MEAWFAPYFVNPAYVAGGAALIASPIIIHLINRLRFRRVRFAAMEFLLQSEQRNRRRILLEQMLLLLLRVLIVLAIVAIIARLVLEPGQLSMFRGIKAHHVVLLDDSGSMQDQWGDTTAIDEALTAIRRIATEGSRRPGSQQFSLILMSNPRQPLFSQRDVDEAFVHELETQLENFKCSHRRLDIVPGLESSRELLLLQRGTMRHLHVISDFRLADWQSRGAVGAAMQALDEADVTVNFVKTVPERHANLALADLRGDMQIAAAGVPLRLTATVQNLGTQVVDEVALTILQNGRKLPFVAKLEKIEPGAEGSVEFDVSFDTPGKHRLQVTLPADALEADNSRFLAVEIPEVNSVLIVDGDPAGREGRYLADALAADPGLTGTSPVIESSEYLRRQPLDRFQAIYLLNVSDLPPDAVVPLENFVNAGGGLVWFLGDTIDAGFYNERLYREGRGLFPVQLGAAPRDYSSRSNTAAGVDLKLTEHEIFKPFLGQDNPFLVFEKIYRYFPVSDEWTVDDQARGDAVRTISFLTDGQPLMFEHRFGQGRIITSLTTCGPVWNNLARTGWSFVPLQLELQKYVARTDRMLQRRVVGEPIEVNLDPSRYTETVEIASPDVGGERVTRIKASPPTSPPQASAVATTPRPDAQQSVTWSAGFRDTDRPGVYRITRFDHDQAAEENWIAYNVSVDEGRLELADNEQIRRQVGENLALSIQEPGSFEWIAGKDVGQELREWLLIALVMMCLAEQSLACRLSYHPRPAGAPA